MKMFRNSCSMLILTVSIICFNNVQIFAGGNSTIPITKIADPSPFIASTMGHENEIKPVVKHEITLLELQELVTAAIPTQDPNQTMRLGSCNGHFANAGTLKITSQLTIYKLNFK